jgi:hypothetical protein
MTKHAHLTWILLLGLAFAGCNADANVDYAHDAAMGDADTEEGCLTDDDCNNGNPCETREQCEASTGACVSIDPLDDGDACGDGRVCDAGLCVLAPGTECEIDANCDDGNSCNGVDYCDEATKTCMVTTCNDGDPCTDNVCSTTGPCTFVFIDQDGDGYAPAVACTNPALQGGDCDDTKAYVHPGAPEVCDLHYDGRLEEVDNNCNGYDGFAPESGLPNLYFRDRDEDTYGDANEGIPCPLAGYVRGDTPTTGSPGAPARRPVDCFDGPSPASVGAQVRPGQLSYFEAPYCLQGVAAQDGGGTWSCTDTPAFVLPSWDYDCNGTEELLWTEAGLFCACDTNEPGGGMVDCDGNETPPRCTPSSWASATPPGCGVTGSWEHCDLQFDGITCIGTLMDRTQRCR